MSCCFRLSVGILGLGITAACGGGYSSPSSPSTSTSTAPTTVTVTMPAGASGLGAGGFTPNPVTVTAGSTVTWVNSDPNSSSHDVAADNGAFDSGTMPNGARFSFTYSTRGSFPYHCARHPGMVGTVVVQ